MTMEVSALPRVASGRRVCVVAGNIRGEVSELVDERDLGSRGDCSP
jgi:hypothetical protein